MGRLRRQASFANLVSVVSLLFALGLGSAWAATELAKNEVKSRHVKNRGLKTNDLADGAVTSVKVADGSLLGGDFASGQIPAGPKGEPGARGPQGARGPAGTARAYGRVFNHQAASCAPNCFVDRSKGISQVTRNGVGSYCVRVPGISSADVAAVVSVDWGATFSPEGNASAMVQSEGGCPTASDFRIRTEAQPVEGATDASGSSVVNVSGVATDSDRVGFTIIVP